eukprot:4408448-Pleurochrysis_carterae.AAC.2
MSISIAISSSTRCARHSGRSVGVADEMNRVAAASRGNGAASGTSTFEWYVAGTCTASSLRSELDPLAEAAEGSDSAALGATEAKMGSEMNPENGTESHLNSGLLSAAAISRPADSPSVLRFFKQYLNHSNSRQASCLHPFPFPFPSVPMQLTGA